MYIRLSWLTLVAGVGLGIFGTMVFGGSPPPFHHFTPQPAYASNGDRFQEYVMMSGAASFNPKGQTDCLWLLDKKSNKLLATIIDRTNARIPGWTEVSLAQEFGVNEKNEPHFLMTTGMIAQGQAALYVVETNTGKIGVYTLGGTSEAPGFVIRRHDLGSFRAEAVGLPERLK
ncbi:hypothetical protein KIH39_12280 [Telmatocola sphagniphila]|uniref:Uncharacterized protein n=1 Tax=Telmatocola sphagniphila TaxID=1123043 RepID=A0A8E6BA18_9BACT|nr:hypothetical protein [Telmatocola sphagniphila]QVL34647.1 hypothetical protein KIH39_12280 [Telmatocola sphagniphila]